MAQKKILFRADGNALVGSGHIMRCRSIASAAIELGADCLFVTADDSFSEKLREAAIETIVLHSDYAHMDDELPALLPLLHGYAPDIMLIDSYHVTPTYLQTLSAHVRTAYMDDILSFPHPVDLLFNYNIYADRAAYEALYAKNGTPLPALFIGTEYAPLRAEFQQLPERPPASEVKSILFSAGGADPERIALSFVNAIIRDPSMISYQFHLVLGQFEPDLEEIQRIAAERPNLILHWNVREMASLMRGCDAAVSAAGSTLYELCACGIPTVTYILADNQIPGAEAFSAKGIMLSAGDQRLSDSFIDELLSQLKQLCDRPTLRRSMHTMGLRCVDGNGASRTARCLST